MALKILLTGANGYVGLRLLSALLEAGHSVCAVVRDQRRLPLDELKPHGDRISFLEIDLAEPADSLRFPADIDVAYFLVHAMGASTDFSERESAIARHFVELMQPTRARQIIYLGGLTPTDGALSPHLASRQNVEKILADSAIPLTVLSASIIVGSGSASFEIIRDLVEKLPVMIAPRWTRNRCQPIGIRNVIGYLVGVANLEAAFGRRFEIGGPEVLTYADLLHQYASERGLRRWLIPVPLLTPHLSSYWLYLVTSTSFRLARALVESLVHDTICHEHEIRQLVPQELLTYREAVQKAFVRIAQNDVPSAWYDALASSAMLPARLRSIHPPEHGVIRDRREQKLTAEPEKVIDAVWALGGRQGWPSMNWAWKIRGWLDRLVGGTGVRRGRRHPEQLRPGDAVDFWRVLVADREEGHLILFAEMRLPGEAWLEFQISEGKLRQTATFRPLGLLGRLYWLACVPFHAFLFPRMARDLAAAR